MQQLRPNPGRPPGAAQLESATSLHTEGIRSKGTNALCASPGEEVKNAQQSLLAGSTPNKLISPHLRRVLVVAGP